MIGKECAGCGRPISPRRSLCPKCAARYGSKRSQWPEWLAFRVSDIAREWDQMRRHPTISLDDDLTPDLYRGLNGFTRLRTRDR